jgi:hypothetical protein
MRSARSGGDETLGVVDFSIYPHLDQPALPENTMADAERWAAGMSVPCYAIDDKTAIKVVDSTVEVISEGHWKRFVPASQNEDDFQPLSVVDCERRRAETCYRRRHL